MSYDTTAMLIKLLPKTLTTHNGDVFNIKWYDGLERHEDPTPPYGEVTFLSKIANSRRFNQGEKLTSVQQTDTFTYAGEEWVQVTQPDIVGISSVTGTVGGLSHTFVEGTDYEKAKTNEYLVHNAVRWLSGGTKPDTSTSYTVVYNHRYIVQGFSQYDRLNYRLGLYAKEFRNGEAPATKNYAKTRLAQDLADALTTYLMVNQGAYLTTDASIRLGQYQPVSDVEIEEGGTLASIFTDITLFRRNIFTDKNVERIGKVDVTRTDEMW